MSKQVILLAAPSVTLPDQLRTTTLPGVEQKHVSTEATAIIFQNRAEAFKAIRERTIDPGARRLLEEIAADYENLAETLTRIKQMQLVVSKRILL